MARKAKLDILETQPEEQPIPEELPSLPELEPTGKQPLRARLQKKFIVVSVIVTGCCLIAAGGLFFWMQAGKKGAAPPSDKQPLVAVTDGLRHNVANLDNFVIDYRGQGDTVRIAIFALAVELNEPVKKDVVENRAELRSDIYVLTKKRSVGALLSPEERGTLRTEIAAELEKRLGAGAVKAVYFTKFTVL